MHGSRAWVRTLARIPDEDHRRAASVPLQHYFYLNVCQVLSLIDEHHCAVGKRVLVGFHEDRDRGVVVHESPGLHLFVYFSDDHVGGLWQSAVVSFQKLRAHVQNVVDCCFKTSFQ